MYTEAELVRIAKRENNTRRKYLVVNRLQGKHIPVSPKEALQMFRSLAELIKEAYPSGEASDGRICRNGNSDRSSSGDRVSGSLYADYAGSH